MKRDMHIVRKILLAAMQSEQPLTSVEGIDPETFDFHVQLLQEGGFLQCSARESNEGSSSEPKRAKVVRLTWTGFDFAESIKDDAIWHKVTANPPRSASCWTFDLLQYALRYEQRRRLWFAV
jgi:hypothetical protein